VTWWVEAIIAVVVGMVVYAISPRWVYWLCNALWSTGTIVYSIFFGHDSTLLRLFALAWCAFTWWLVHKNLPPRDRRRIKKLVGAKTRALRDRLVATMPKPRTVPA
jgi:hypothetical protein